MLISSIKMNVRSVADDVGPSFIASTEDEVLEGYEEWSHLVRSGFIEGHGSSAELEEVRRGFRV